jgi:predicted transcriptional regulator
VEVSIVDDEGRPAATGTLEAAVMGVLWAAHAVLQLFAESLDRSDAELLRQLLAESRRHR